MTIEAKVLSYGHKGRVIGCHLTFSIPSGKITCLLGKNGSGKSTLLKTLLGLLPISSGQVFIKNISIDRWKRPLLARTMAYVSQQNHRILPYTGEEIALMGRMPYLSYGSSISKKDRKIVYEVFQELKISYLAPQLYTQMSGGEKQLVLIAKALAQETDILILDEPTVNLDLANRIQVLDTMNKLSELGMTILFTSHYPEEANWCADKILLLKNGQIMAQGLPSEILVDQILQEAYDLPCSKIRAWIHKD